MRLFSKLPAERKYEILGVLTLALTVFLFIALASDGYLGDSQREFFPVKSLGEVPNALRVPGAVLAGVLYILFGQAAHVLYVLTCVWGMTLLRHRPVDRFPARAIGALLLIASISGILHANFTEPGEHVMPGGTIGAFVTSLVYPHFGTIGGIVVAVTLAAIGLLLSTDFLFVKVLRWTGAAVVLMIRALNEIRKGIQFLAVKGNNYLKKRRVKKKQRMLQLEVIEDQKKAPIKTQKTRALPPAQKDLSRIRVTPAGGQVPFDEIPEVEEVPPRKSGRAARQLDLPSTPVKSGVSRKGTAADTALDDEDYPPHYTPPPLTILSPATPSAHNNTEDDLRETGLLLEETLLTYGVEAKVTDVTRGPTITRFEVEPSPGIKVNRFIALADDLALALKAHRVRVEAPIPGKGKVGIEVPNEIRDSVVIRDLIDSAEFRNGASGLTLALGKDIAGDVVTADLAGMPHLLVAGATGAGKTVYVKSVLASLLFNKTPDELQLMLIDPKMVELSIFNDIPHLITPVVIDAKKAAAALNWLINEMEERYRLFAHLRVRNIEVYNDSVQSGEITVGETEVEGQESYAIVRKLPYIVCIIDELADLMMMARAEVEDAIARLAQLARAVGIHLVIATQRPSVDVLTGVIKANFPARVSFQVSSRVDSRCILDEIGAERLIGHGDMLYLPAGQSKPTRIQGAFVSDKEMNELIAYLKTQAPPQYRDEIENFGKKRDAIENLADESDELFDDAVRVVTETGQASISMVQRRLRVGYTRAARLIDMMELRGIVGPHVGSKAREILVPVSQNNDEVA